MYKAAIVSIFCFLLLSCKNTPDVSEVSIILPKHPKAKNYLTYKKALYIHLEDDFDIQHANVFDRDDLLINNSKLGHPVPAGSIESYIRPPFASWHNRYDHRTFEYDPWFGKTIGAKQYTNINYWLIELTKRLVSERYIGNDNHPFHPWKYGGKSGPANDFNYDRLSDRSFIEMKSLLERHTKTNERTIHNILAHCYPALAIDKYKLKHAPKLSNKEKYALADNKEMPFLCKVHLESNNANLIGLPLQKRLSTKIVETHEIIDPEFHAGFYHFLLNTKTHNLENESWAVNFFPNLKNPFLANYTYHIPNNDKYVLDRDKFADKDLIASFGDPAVMFARHGEKLVGDRNLKINMGVRNPYKVGKVTGILDVPLLNNCQRLKNEMRVHYSKAAYVAYHCTDELKIDNLSSGAPYLMEADVTLSMFDERETLKQEYTYLPPLGSVYLNINTDILKRYGPGSTHADFTKDEEYMKYYQSKFDEMTERLIRNSVPNAFLAWVSVEGGTIWGNVSYYGMLFKYKLNQLTYPILVKRVSTGMESRDYIRKLVH